MKYTSQAVMACAAACLLGGAAMVQAGTPAGVNDGLYNEPYRPQVHYSPARHWMNDPNGLVYHAGETQMF